MSRKLMRVAMNFSWPLKKTWKGYLNPFWEERKNCSPCEGTGYSPDGRFLNDLWYRHISWNMFGNWYGSNILAVPDSGRLRHMGWGEDVIANIERARKFGFKILAHWNDKLDQEDINLLVEKGRLIDFTHTWTKGKGWKKKNPLVIPTPDEVAVWQANSAGHDAINQGVCVEGRCKRLGIKYLCADCKGHGYTWPDPEVEKKYDDWKPEDPPAGEGYQLWEDTSEGSPISPVFKTLDELCEWAAKNATTFADFRASAEVWKKMLLDDNVHAVKGNAFFM